MENSISMGLMFYYLIQNSGLAVSSHLSTRPFCSLVDASLKHENVCTVLIVDCPPALLR